MSGHKIKTPHAAVLVWNYVDRVGVPTGSFDATGVDDLIGVEKENLPVIVSTLSCVSIQTSKSKGQPDGQFNLVLAPYKNWVSTLTTGSWCCIMMSNIPIKEEDLKTANPEQVKMIGRIESVRCETTVDDDGTRKTLYYVSGVDWGTVFNSTLYIDNLIAEPNDPQSLGNGAAVAIRNALFGKNGSPQSFAVVENLTSILGVMGKTVGGYTEDESKVGRLANAIYEFSIPAEMAKFFNFLDKDGNPITSIEMKDLLSLTTGSLKSDDEYFDHKEAVGFIDPFSLQGTHTLWQILLENSNPALNEMFTDLKWTDEGVQLKLYNRIRPFSFQGFDPQAGSSDTLRSYFQYVKTHDIDVMEVISVNAGTNWRDKFNFVEIKPQFQEFEIVANWYKRKAQAYDKDSFNREGFRPLIFDTKQFPSKGTATGLANDVGIDWDQLEVWTKLLREWYFGTHRMLNGTIVLHGQNEYIGVGNNIKFDIGLINPNPNFNAKLVQKGTVDGVSVLAHVENVSHSFTVSADGARSYRTTIQFVRGIIVNPDGSTFGDGMLDQAATSVSQPRDRNRLNTISTSDSTDPDPQRVGRGQKVDN